MIHIIKRIGLICQYQDGWCTPIILIVPTFKYFFLAIYWEMPQFYWCILQSTVDSICIIYNNSIDKLTLHSVKIKPFTVSVTLLVLNVCKNCQAFCEYWKTWRRASALSAAGKGIISMVCTCGETPYFITQFLHLLFIPKSVPKVPISHAMHSSILNKAAIKMLIRRLLQWSSWG